MNFQEIKIYQENYLDKFSIKTERFNDISFAEFDVAGETVYHTAPIPFAAGASDILA